MSRLLPAHIAWRFSSPRVLSESRQPRLRCGLERVIKEPKTLILHDELRSPKRSLKLKMPKPKAPSRNGLSAAKGLKTQARNPLDELLAAHAASASKIASALPFRAAA